MNDLKYGIAWNDSFKIGYEQVDSQHYRLFELLSELVGSCAEGKDVPGIGETLDFLVNYTVQHFCDEESLQVQYNYPDYARHKELHEKFKIAVGELVGRYAQSGSAENLKQDINRVVVRWLISHIQQEDKRIGNHIREVTERGDRLSVPE